jgi:hypothetical protein
MIELSLTSGSTGKKIVGKPTFDEKAFSTEASPDSKTTKRKLTEVDEQLDDLFNTLQTYKATGRGRKLASDEISDEKKGFSWTVSSYERTGFKFKITYNDPSFVSNENADEMGIKFHDADKYLIGEDGLKVPVTDVKIKMPKQMSAEALALITTCIFGVKILVVVPIVTVLLSLLL